MKRAAASAAIMALICPDLVAERLKNLDGSFKAVVPSTSPTTSPT